MAAHQCIKCNQPEMTWAIDEEKSKFTYWHCGACKEIVAWEDESKERNCTFCNHEVAKIH